MSSDNKLLSHTTDQSVTQQTRPSSRAGLQRNLNPPVELQSVTQPEAARYPRMHFAPINEGGGEKR